MELLMQLPASNDDIYLWRIDVWQIELFDELNIYHMQW